MIPVRVSRRAFNDLNAIWEHIASDNEEAANRHQRQLSNSMLVLAEQPFLDQARPEFGVSARALIVGDYLIVYEVRPDRVHVSRVIHRARDIPRALGDSPDEHD